jgi:3-oxoacyl-[acyl-carrier protein] reductase/tetrahydroxynaphthalene reductase
MSSTNATLKGKVALVTGAGRGIGAGIARELGARGASVVVNYRGSAAAAEALAGEITAGGSSAIAIQADISNVDEIKALFQKAKKHYGKIDIVVSNSGIEHFGALPDVKPEDFDRVFNLNTRGQFFVGQQAYEHISDGGRLILMSSISAHNAIKEHAVYAGSKCAVEAFARCFSQDFGSRRITVNSIAPGGVKTDMATDVGYKYLPMADASWTWEQIEGIVAKRTPMGRIADPVDIARVAAFLASDDGGWVNGQNITISGGASG